MLQPKTEKNKKERKKTIEPPRFSSRRSHSFSREFFLSSLFELPKKASEKSSRLPSLPLSLHLTPSLSPLPPPSPPSLPSLYPPSHRPVEKNVPYLVFYGGENKERREGREGRGGVVGRGRRFPMMQGKLRGAGAKGEKINLLIAPPRHESCRRELQNVDFLILNLTQFSSLSSLSSISLSPPPFSPSRNVVPPLLSHFSHRRQARPRHRHHRPGRVVPRRAPSREGL